MRKCISVIIVFLIIGGCEDDYPIKKGNIQFSFSSLSGSGGRMETLTKPVAVLLSIEDNDGNSIEQNKKILLYTFGNGYVSESLQLATGTYQLAQFMVLDADNKVIYATPVEGSELAQYVNDPLPIEFVVSDDGTTLVTPQVLAVDADNTPENFGYVSFSFEVVSPLPRLTQIKVFEGGLSYATHRLDYTYSNNGLDEVKFYYCYPDEQNCNTSAWYKFEYYPDGRIKGRYLYDAITGNVVETDIYEYEGILTKKINRYYDQYNTSNAVEFFYDQNNKLTHSTLGLGYSSENSNYRLSEYTHNDDGSITEHVYLDGLNKDGLRFIFTYTFDQYNTPSLYNTGIAEWVLFPVNKNVTSITLKEIYQAGDPPPDCSTNQAYQYNALGLPESYVTSNPENCYLGFMDGTVVQYFYNQ